MAIFLSEFGEFVKLPPEHLFTVCFSPFYGKTAMITSITSNIDMRPQFSVNIPIGLSFSPRIAEYATSRLTRLTLIIKITF
jgi:hypothetical protein